MTVKTTYTTETIQCYPTNCKFYFFDRCTHKEAPSNNEGCVGQSWCSIQFDNISCQKLTRKEFMALLKPKLKFWAEGKHEGYIIPKEEWAEFTK